jgi:hypothetical protein
VRVRAVAAAAVACLGLTLLAAWFFEWSFEKAAFLSPVIVVAAGAAAGLVVLWTRVAWESLRKARRPKLVVALALGGLLLLVGLSVLGLKLPKE